MVKQFQNNIKHWVRLIWVLGCHRKTLSVQIIEILRQHASAFKYIYIFLIVFPTVYNKRAETKLQLKLYC